MDSGIIGKEWNSQILANLSVTSVLRWTDSYARTRGLKHLQLPDVRMNSGPPDETRVFHGTDELLIEQGSLPDGEVPTNHSNRAEMARIPGACSIWLMVWVVTGSQGR